MKKILGAILLSIPMIASAQSAVDAYTLSQTDFKGTARYMSMAGAYGALGGDISAINQNPGGIGVYRSSDIGLTFNLDLQSTKSSTGNTSSTVSQTKFNINSLGYVGSYKLDSSTMPYINWGFSYNRPVSYNRHYSGKISDIRNSLTNYIADRTNQGGYTSADMAFEEGVNGEIYYDPYYDSNTPWLNIMTYNSYTINPSFINSNGVGTEFKGLFNATSQGFSEYEVIEEGGVNEFNLNLGGNVADMLYWGFAFGIHNMDFSKYTYYGESLSNATVVNDESQTLSDDGVAAYGLNNWLNTSGNGWNFKLGVIFKPVHELRFGLAFHTPTYWTLTDESYATLSYETIGASGYTRNGIEEANAGYTYECDYRIKTPWKFNASVAAVIGSKAIISGEYERVAYDEMSIEYSDGYYSYYEDALTQKSIKDIYKAMNIFKIGAEFRASSQVSIRLGYAYQTSPVNDDAMNGKYEIDPSGTIPSYAFDKSTQYITAGIGYRYKSFYTDLAYIHKTRESEYKSFSQFDAVYNQATFAPTATIKDNNNQIVWSIGYRF